MPGRIKDGTFVRSIHDLGDYNDDEINNEPSMTDPSHDVSIEDLIKRMCRGEGVPSIEPSFDGEISPDLGPDALMARQPVYEREGFDITQAAPILEAASAASPDQPPPPPPVAADPAAASAPVPADLKEAGGPINNS